jgi:hypothetical protein
VQVIQQTNWPESGDIELRVATPHPAEFALHLRMPNWLDSPGKIAVNGKPFSAAAEKRSFAVVRRRWRDGDTVQLHLPLGFRTEAIDDKHPERVALMRGPLMMVAANANDDPAEIALNLPGKPEAIAYRASAFRIAAPELSVEIVPFHLIQDETYTTYLKRRL